jgi:hypothetical protein
MSRATLPTAIVLLASAVLSAQSQAPAPNEKPGIYLDGTNEVRRLPMESSSDVEVKGVAKAAFTYGIAKPKQLVKHSGAKSAFVIKGAVPPFVFRFPPKNMPRDPMAMMAYMGDDALPFGTKHPKDFVLAQATVDAGTRVFDSGKIVKIKFEIEQLKPDTFRVRIAAPLTPGEYAFFMGLGGGAPTMIWSFSYQN